MGSVKRYDMQYRWVSEVGASTGVALERHNGKYVLHSDYLALQQVARQMQKALGGIASSLTKGNRGDDRMLNIDSVELQGLLAESRAALAAAAEVMGNAK